MKNKDIPSIPIAKLKLRLGNHNNSLTNWKEAIDFSKKPHKNKEQLKDKHVEFRATIFNNLILWKGINNKNKIPKIGNIKFKIKKFLLININFKIILNENWTHIFALKKQSPNH